MAKLTVPDGKAVPAAGLTIAVSWVVPFCAMVGGLAAATTVVATGPEAAVTVTVIEPVEAPQLLSPL
jgi:hypothetical protein